MLLVHWVEMTSFWIETGTLLVVFREVSLRVMESLGVSFLRRLTTHVVNVDDIWELLTREMASDMFTCDRELFREGKLPIFEIEAS